MTAQPEKNQAIEVLRAVAVSLVILTHGLTLSTDSVFNPINVGAGGVRLFFVISGFLITGILLDQRARAERLGASRAHVLGAFYMRRAVRILPLAYGVILVGSVFGVAHVREYAWWYVAYLNNVALPHLTVPSLGHFWSLAIEEQFYVVWPTIILFAPRRALPVIIIGSLIGPALWRGVLSDETAAYIGTLSRVDGLAMGAGLAIAVRSSRRAWQLPGLLALAAGALLIGEQGDATMRRVFSESGMVIASGVIVLLASRVERIPRWHALKPIVWIGSVSYGLYVWHYFLPELLRAAEQRLDVWLRIPTAGSWTYLAWTIAMSVPAAALSWWLFERPFNDLKRYFVYVRPAVLRTARDASHRQRLTTGAMS